jgi:xanthine dehydrogenase accessory factor
VRDVLAELMSIWRTGGTAGVATVMRTERADRRIHHDVAP